MADAKTPAKKFYLGTGRRKTAVARVRLAEGSGKIVINGRGLDDYFTEEKDRGSVLRQLERAENRPAVLLLGEIVVQPAAVDHDLAATFGQSHASHGGLPPARAQVELLRGGLGVRHGQWFLG